MSGGTGDGVGRKVADTAKAAALPTIVSFVALVAGVPAVMEGFRALGWNIIPWADKAEKDDVKSLSDRVESLEIDKWTRKLKEANAELKRDPLSESAEDKKAEAERELRKLGVRLRRSQP